MNSKVLLKIVFAIVCIVLLAFIGTGVYFCMNDRFGAGLIGLGIGLVGAGITGFLVDGVLFHVKDYDALKQQEAATKAANVKKQAVAAHTNVDLVMTASIHSECGSEVKDSLTAGIKVTKEGVTIEGLYPSPVTLFYDGLDNVIRESDKVRILGSFKFRERVRDNGMFLITTSSAIKAKALEQGICKFFKKDGN